jgi:hypothetical protein
MTKFNCGPKKGCDGNTILLKIKKDRYVFIGWCIYEFLTKDDIKEYISPVGNSDVPYPVAIGEKNVYFMLDMRYVPISEFNSFTKEVKQNAYAYYYGRSGDEPLSKHSSKMKSVKMIQKRLY